MSLYWYVFRVNVGRIVFNVLQTRGPGCGSLVPTAERPQAGTGTRNRPGHSSQPQSALVVLRFANGMRSAWFCHGILMG